jgi:hypothetical protein
MRVGVPNGFLNIQKAIAGIKTHWFEDFFISLEAIEMYMSKMGSYDPFGHLKHKLCPKKRLEVKLSM